MEAIPAEILQEIVRRLVLEFDPDQIILFGSHAWAEPNADSDVDLFVIVPETQEHPVKLGTRAHSCLRGIPFPKDIIVQSRDKTARYSRVPGSLETKILKDGIKLYGRSQEGAVAELAPQVAG
jgi:Polymerase beta, Nucleotidyltransferase